MYLRHLYPNVRSFTEDESVRYRFGAEVSARIGGLECERLNAVRTLWRRFSCDASELNLAEGAEGYRLILGEADISLNAGDTYAIRACESGVCVVGADGNGLLDGIKTLVQLICPEELSIGREELYISSCEIHDAPAIPFRAIHICVFPDSRLYTIEKAIRLAGFLKMTHVILEFWGTLQYDCLGALAWRGRSYSKADIRPLIDAARENGMEVIPMLNHLGHATQSRACYGRHTVLNGNPRLSRLFEPDGWTWCVSNEDTYKLLADMRGELMELAGDGRYFHLGLDEAYSFATCDRCRKKAPAEMLAQYVNRLTDDLARFGRRPIIWHDQLIDRADFGPGPIVANGGHQHTAGALDMIDRRVIIADWQYDYRDGFNPTSAYFMEKGFDTVLCPWDSRENILSLTSDAKRLGAYGVILTTWHHLTVFLRDAGTWADAAWSPAGQAQDAPITESACLLRRVYDAEGSFGRSGWNYNEVEQ